MDKEKLEIIGVLSSLILSVISLFNIIFENYNKLTYIILLGVFVTNILSCFYWRNRNSIIKRYKLNRYLFFEIDENKFNIVPKILLFFDLHKKRNYFRVDTISVNYTLVENDGIINSNVVWNLEGVSAVNCNSFYFYTGIDLGTICKQELIVSCNDKKETVPLLSDNKIDSRNDIFLCHWNIPNYLIKNKNKIDKIELTMEQKDSFDLSNKEVVYFLPWNFAYRIENLKFEITYPKAIGKIFMQLFEVGDIKGEKFPFHKSIAITSNESHFENEEKGTFTYKFDLSESNINIDNLYYILLHKSDK